ncbi:MAG TPA: glycosyltransferase family 1 protein [Bryobacteraceae bacterium]|jgi:alpha-1,3-rhamnosyl/mannosyltransferase|nr:glycosyltransferase family 1 protein [Bryobacteraceae bacterium]
MIIAIDATPLLVRSAGVKGYIWHWIEALRKRAGDATVRAFPFIGKLPPLLHDQSIFSPARTYPRLAALHASNKIPGFIDLVTAGATVFHSSNQIRRKPVRCRLSATVHDLTSWSHPTEHMAGTLRLDFDFADRVLKHADALIAVSDNTRRDAIEYLRIDPKKIRRIYSGVPDAYFNVTEREIAAARSTFVLNKPYVLYVGTIEPRKNLDRLLTAWSTLPEDVQAEFELVVAGPYGWRAEATLAQLRSLSSGVRYLGYVAEEHLPGLTGGAILAAYPSLYEGFGFPVAQAMAAHVPVLTSNTSCLPEVAGEGALFVDPLSIAEIGAALNLLLTSPSLRDRLAVAGRRRAAIYTWDRCAAESIQFFEELSG